MKAFIRLALAALLAAAAGPSAAQKPSTITFTIDEQHPQQPIDGFGASDAWSMNRMGLWSDASQRQVADWLFSTDNDAQGQPRGIGLSIWRFNLGAGSAEQGDSAHIHRGTRTECFLRPDGTYDWTRQAGQRRFLRLAKERGVTHFLAFLNSAPVYFTQNGLATNTGRGGTMNLKADCYDAFARFIATSLEGVERHDGIHFDYISPINEPDGHWNWLGPKQEGSPATNREVARLVCSLSQELLRKGLTTKIVVNESSDYRCLWGTHETDWQRGYHVASFFSPDSTATYVGNLPNVLPLIAAHSYWTNTPLQALHDHRQHVAQVTRQHGIGFWMSEVCIMGNDEEIGGGGGYDFSMTTALYVARMIHYDLCVAQARSWQWWRAAGGDYKDGLLREYGTPDGGEGPVKDSRLLWALGNYSRFVRPGAVRMEVSGAGKKGATVGATDPKGLMVSAFRNADGSRVVVAINYGEQPVRMAVSTNGTKAAAWQLYRTSDRDGECLRPVGTTASRKATTLPARSITTFVSRPAKQGNS